MEKITPFILFSILMSSCSSTGIVSTGADTFMIAKSGGGPGASGAEISAGLYKEANKFCNSSGRQFVQINVTEQDNKPFVRLANSKLEFRCDEKSPK